MVLRFGTNIQLQIHSQIKEMAIWIRLGSHLTIFGLLQALRLEYILTLTTPNEKLGQYRVQDFQGRKPTMVRSFGNLSIQYKIFN